MSDKVSMEDANHENLRPQSVACLNRRLIGQVFFGGFYISVLHMKIPTLDVTNGVRRFLKETTDTFHTLLQRLARLSNDFKHFLSYRHEGFVNTIAISAVTASAFVPSIFARIIFFEVFIAVVMDDVIIVRIIALRLHG
ncbi:hypothetical protein ACHAXS_008972 [Conticribra weissflogii]